MKSRLEKKRPPLTEKDSKEPVESVRVSLESLDLQRNVVYLVSNGEEEGTITLRKSGEQQPTDENGGQLWTMGIKDGRSVKIRKKRKRLGALSSDTGSDSKSGEGPDRSVKESQEASIPEAGSRVAPPPNCRLATAISHVNKDKEETVNTRRKGCGKVNRGAQSMQIQTRKSVKLVLPITPAASDDVTNESENGDESSSSDEIEVPIQGTSVARPNTIQKELVFLTPSSMCNEAQVNVQKPSCSKNSKSHEHEPPLNSNGKLSTEMPSSKQQHPTATRETARKSNQGPTPAINTTATAPAGKAMLIPRPYFFSTGETKMKAIPIPKSHDTALEMSEGRKNTLLGIESAGLSASEKENKRRGNISSSESETAGDKEVLTDTKRRRRKGRTLKDLKKPLQLPPPAFVPEKTLRQRIRGSNSISNIPHPPLNTVDPKIMPPPTTLPNRIEIPSASSLPLNNFISSENNDDVENPSELARVSDLSLEKSTGVKKLGETTISNLISSVAGNLRPKTSPDVNVRTIPKQPNRPTVQRVEVSIHAKKNLPKTMPNRKSNQPESCPSVKVVDGKSKFMQGGIEVIVDADPKLPRETPKYDVSVPWICFFCNKSPFAIAPMPMVLDDGDSLVPCVPYSMGDLFGPYFAKLPSDNGEPPKEREIWMHGADTPCRRSVLCFSDCALWTRFLKLSGPKLVDLEENLKLAEETICPICMKPGASIVCSDPGCGESVHFPCAKWHGWMFNNADFKPYCRRHLLHSN
ncbi:unnamed protein product [Orchesella dallaii]|uniref:PHD-type domain-containing protein n=1 Tax=Orchesella dallaii TaxID=48710 RepID=A0ABP1RF38_9HEXA